MRSGCTVETIRFYEKEKLLVSNHRSAGNYRLFDTSAIDQLRFIRHCRSLDLSLAEIRQLLTLNQSPGSQCDDVNRMINSHISQVALRITELENLRRQLESLRNNCASNRTVEQCGILQNLTESET
jgi:Cd(II)/Pb(II)-responsive transcriptional regulator